MEAIDAYRCAKLLLDRYGVDAPLHAAIRTDELGADGDYAGVRAWLAIMSAMDVLTIGTRAPSEPVH